MSSLARKLYYFLPPGVRLAARWLFFLPYDLLQSLKNKDGQILPPRRLIYTGGGDFLQAGKDFIEDLRQRDLIHAHSQVLDVGSGIGRMAIPLTEVVTNGSYKGFDIMPVGIHWCRKNITSRFPHFKFTLADLSNDLYRNQGKEAETFRFPYNDAQFDLIIVISVFTHLVADEVTNYTNEIHRVLKKGGACYATFFILNETSKKAMDKEGHDFNFKIIKKDYRQLDKDVRSANVAFEENFLKNNIFPSDKYTVEDISYGTWSTGGKGVPISFQDRVVVRKI